MLNWIIIIYDGNKINTNESNVISDAKIKSKDESKINKDYRSRKYDAKSIKHD